MAQLIHRASFTAPGGANGSGSPVQYSGRVAGEGLFVMGTFDGATVVLETQSLLVLPDGTNLAGNWMPVRNTTFTAPEMREVALYSGQSLRATVTNAGAATNIFVQTGV